MLAAALACAIGPPPAGAAPSCLGKAATIVDRSGPVRGTRRADVIVAGPGRNVIRGGGGNDRICAGGGDDRVLGEVGSDVVDAGAGDDEVDGGNGSDVVLGGHGTDILLGKRGNDRLLGGEGERDFADGGVGDDTVDGGPGNFDQVIGSIGNDSVLGGPGDGDVLRGALGRDAYDGGEGLNDTASYAVAGKAGTVSGGRGVQVDLNAGTASADGDDDLTGIEDVIGTAFRDTIVGNAEANLIHGGGGDDHLAGAGPGDTAVGGSGIDSCLSFASTDCEHESPVPPWTYFDFTPEARIQVDVAGGVDAASLTAIVDFPTLLLEKEGVQITTGFEGGEWVVSASGLPITTGGSCRLAGPAQVRCPISGAPDAILLGGSGGRDRLEIHDSVPPQVSGRIMAEEGDDHLLGGEGDDTLNGAAGTDTLLGRGGEDALIYAQIGDGGEGSDLLIGSPCNSETLEGGPGIDSVSFARSYFMSGTLAEIGGIAGAAPFDGVHHDIPAGCPDDVPGIAPTFLGHSIESIEGSKFDDILIGDGSRNQLLGRGGDDRLHGMGSDDFLVGGAGRDRLFGGGGPDRLYARDNARDAEVDCGPNPLRGDVAFLDAGDPRPRRCRLPRAG
jgi:Ca2+-binding RTX toxin-like protein